jgi:hypothetical protein
MAAAMHTNSFKLYENQLLNHGPDVLLEWKQKGDWFAFANSKSIFNDTHQETIIKESLKKIIALARGVKSVHDNPPYDEILLELEKCIREYTGI